MCYLIFDRQVNTTCFACVCINIDLTLKSPQRLMACDQQLSQCHASMVAHIFLLTIVFPCFSRDCRENPPNQFCYGEEEDVFFFDELKTCKYTIEQNMRRRAKREQADYYFCFLPIFNFLDVMERLVIFYLILLLLLAWLSANSLHVCTIYLS